MEKGNQTVSSVGPSICPHKQRSARNTKHRVVLARGGGRREGQRKAGAVHAMDFRWGALRGHD
eukprot:8514265-Pyramimonas_sp.AAC.1